MTWSVPAALEGERLDRVVSLLADISRSRASTVIAAGGVTVNGEVVVDRRVRIQLDDEIEAAVPDVAPRPLRPDPSVAFEVRYEDDHLIVVDKPPGLVVHPGAGHPDATLCHGLLARYPEVGDVGDAERPGIVHRLDKGTSGLLVVARTVAAHQALIDMLTRHEVEREYTTMVWGEVEGSEGLVDAPIGRSRRDPTRQTVTPRGRPARTRFRVERHLVDPTRTVLTCWLETGRTHQIRVHLSSIGHPVVGDATYRGAPLPGSVLDRPWLHARALRFQHPLSDTVVSVESPLPDDLAATLVP